jgi:PAS domain S-box-containing protein
MNGEQVAQKGHNIVVVGGDGLAGWFVEVFSVLPGFNMMCVFVQSESEPASLSARKHNRKVSKDLSLLAEVNDVDMLISLSGVGVPFDKFRANNPGCVILGKETCYLIGEMLRAQTAMFSDARETDERYRDLVENTGQVVAVIDRDGVFRFVNNTAAHLLGALPQDVAGKTIWDVFPYEDAERQLKAIRTGIESGQTLAAEIETPIGDGKKWYETTIYPIRKNGISDSAFVIANDITERKKAAQKIKDLQLQQQAILDNIPDMVWLKDINSRFVAVNGSFAAAAGYLQSELAGKNDFDIWPYELAEAYVRDDKEVMKNGERKLVEEPIVGSDNLRKSVETIKTPVWDEKGDIIGTTGIARDITDRKKIQKALQQEKETVVAVNKELKWKIEELEAALSHIKTLEGLIPICVNCKKMRIEDIDPKDADAWVPLEKYLTVKTDASLTHGLCPDCVKKMTGEYIDKKRP